MMMLILAKKLLLMISVIMVMRVMKTLGQMKCNDDYDADNDDHVKLQLLGDDIGCCWKLC